MNIFIDNKYTLWYKRIIERAKKRCCTHNDAKILFEIFECHHIIPESFFINRRRKGPAGNLQGNPNCLQNLVYLTPKEHFICHLLLTKMLSGENLEKMRIALYLLTNQKQKKKLTSNQYSTLRKEISLIHKKEKSKVWLEKNRKSATWRS